MISKFKLKKKQKNNKKKGFTLVELLAVIVILAVIMIITIPTVIGSMNNAKLKAEEIFIASIEKSIGNFIEKELQYVDYTFEEPKKDYINEDIANKYKVSKVKINEGGTHNNITFELFDELGFYPKSDLINPRTDEKCSSDAEIEIYKSKFSNEYYYYTKLGCLENPITNLKIPEEPELSGGLIPVVYDSNGDSTDWFVADISTEWYNYDKQEWANAVLVDLTNSDIISKYKEGQKFIVGKEIEKDDMIAMFVWIPRFSYTIGCGTIIYNNIKCFGYQTEGASNLSLNTPGAIDIKFTLTNTIDTIPSTINRPSYNYSTNDDRNPTNWMTHPAFWWDEDGDGEREEGEEISGIWVGKFETSGNKTSEPSIIPNEYVYGDKSLSTQLKMVKYFNTKYNLSGDVHIMKSSEWGAVAYLSQSTYGKYGNRAYSGNNKLIYPNNSYSSGNSFTGSSYGKPADSSYSKSPNGTYNYDTIKGVGSSTTGTIYGIYDMVGGLSEIVMGNYNDTVHSSSNLDSNWFNSNKKYYNLFKNIDITNNFSTQTLGHGFSEVYDSGRTWENSYIYSPGSGAPWAIRGGSSLNVKDSGGIFYTSGTTGRESSAFRTVLSIPFN